MKKVLMFAAASMLLASCGGGGGRPTFGDSCSDSGHIKHHDAIYLSCQYQRCAGC